MGYASGKNKDASLVNKAFTKIESPLNEINIFHTDRGNEFKNNLIDNLLNTFKIERSLSKKGCPYDNAVAEATFKIIKTEFAFNKIFDSLEVLGLELFDYVNWYNNERIHGSLGYLTPVQFTKSIIKKKLSDGIVRLYALIIALVLTFIFAKSGTGVEGILLTIINSILVSIASMG